MIYRSGLRMSSPLGVGGHHLRVVREKIPDRDRRGMAQWPRPILFQCMGCYLLVPGYLLREGFYPQPCMGLVRSLEAAS